MLNTNCINSHSTLFVENSDKVEYAIMVDLVLYLAKTRSNKSWPLNFTFYFSLSHLWAMITLTTSHLFLRFMHVLCTLATDSYVFDFCFAISFFRMFHGFTCFFLCLSIIFFLKIIFNVSLSLFKIHSF